MSEHSKNDNMTLGKKMAYYNNLLVKHYFYFADELRSQMRDAQKEYLRAASHHRVKEERYEELHDNRRGALRQIDNLTQQIQNKKKENMTDDEKLELGKYFKDINFIFFNLKKLFSFF